MNRLVKLKCFYESIMDLTEDNRKYLKPLYTFISLESHQFKENKLQTYSRFIIFPKFKILGKLINTKYLLKFLIFNNNFIEIFHVRLENI